MLRSRIVIPLVFSSLAFPALGDIPPGFCSTASSSALCQVERAKEFAKERNAEIAASIAAVKAERERTFAAARNAEIEASLAAVMAERERSFAETRNGEIEASIAAVKAERARVLSWGLTHCKSPEQATPRCEAERAKEFAKARNAEIEASVAAVKAERERTFAAARNEEIDASIVAVRVARARDAVARSATHCRGEAPATPSCEAERAREFALSLTHCKDQNSMTPRCEAEFAQARNAEIEASLAAVETERARAALALSLTHCKSPEQATPRCEAERTREFAKARNAEIEASVAAVERVRTFEKARNAEIEASLAAVKAERKRAFVKARNVEIDASITAVSAERAREFAIARNAEIEASLAAVKAERERIAFAKERNAEIEAWLAAVKAERERTFAAARNAEIDASIAAYEAQRALRLARKARMETPVAATPARSSSLETGAIKIPETPTRPGAAETSRQTLSAAPCRAMGQPLDPVQFPGVGTDVDESMKPMLDRIVMIAKTCPAVRVEIHGYSDASGPVQVSRRLSERRAQAALDYLVGAGVEANRIVAIGHGATDPRASDTSEMNRAKNRRIEFTLRDPALEAAAARVMWDLAELLDPTYVPPLARLSP